MEVLAEFQERVNGYTSHTIISIFACDDDESLWCELRIGDHLVEIPFEVLANIVKVAPEGVHSETWYEKNMYSKERNS